MPKVRTLDAPDACGAPVGLSCIDPPSPSAPPCRGGAFERTSRLRQQAGFDHPRHVDAIDHEDVPVAGLRLLDDGERGAGAFVFLEIDPDVVGLFEGGDQCRIGVVAPHQGVQLFGGVGDGREGQAGGNHGNPQEAATEARHRRLPLAPFR
jgi:hypothetical protein